ncbi:MAG: ABC transporter ATP-binding protein [Planctomycetes bacterium]|nr:ABC transporter ATP-binding protein [Planctomycetota bacterium]
MIRVQQLFKRFGTFEALKYLDFEVASGESVGLLGENGAGKTTTMRVLSCFLPPTSGLVEVAGHEVVFESAAVRRKIGYLPESVPIYGGMRVEEFLKYRARLKGLRGRAVKEGVDRVLGEVDLIGRRRSLVQNLSKGLRQRVGLADALVHDPELLILDEPTSGLDPSQRREVRDLIRNLEGRHTVLVSSHILPEIEATCRRVLVIHDGRVVAQESIDSLRRLGTADRFLLRARGDLVHLEAAVARIEGLELVQSRTEDGIHELILNTEDRQDGRPQIVAAAVAAGLDVVELRAANVSLEDAFLRLIGKGDDA